MQIDQNIAKLKYGPRVLREDLPAIPATDLGCCKADPEFSLRAADLLLGADAGQFEELVQSLSNLSKDIGLDSGDPAYADAAVLLRCAAQALHGRLGN